MGDSRRGEFSLLSGWHGVFGYVCFSQIEKPFDLLLADRRKVCEEFVDRVPFSEVIEQRRDRHARSGKTGYTPLNLGADRDYSHNFPILSRRMRLDEFPSSASGRGINLKIGGNLQEAEASGLPKERTRTPAIRRWQRG